MKRIFVIALALALPASSVLAAEGADPSKDIRIAGPDALGSYWSPVDPASAVTYPPDLAARKVTGCVTLAYMVEPDGSTSGFRTLEADASARSPVARRQAIERFAQAAAGAVAQWRYQPKGEARRTLTATTVQFDDGGTGSAQRCGNGDLARALDKGKNWDRALRDLYEAKSRYWTAPQNERQPSAFIK